MIGRTMAASNFPRTTGLLAGMLVFAMGALPVHAATNYWDGGSSSDWMMGGNWNPDGVPSGGNTYIIDTTPANTAAVSSTAFAGSELVIASNGTLRAERQTMTANGTIALAGGTILSTGSGDPIFGRSLTAASYVAVTNTTTTFNLNGTYGSFMVNGGISGSGTIRRIGNDASGYVFRLFDVNSPGFTGDMYIEASGSDRVGVTKVINLPNVSRWYLQNARLYLNIGNGTAVYGEIHMKNSQLNTSDTGGGTAYGPLIVESDSELGNFGNGYDSGLTLRSTVSGAAKLTLNALYTKYYVFTPTGGGAAASAGSSYTGELAFNQPSNGVVYLQLANVDFQAGGLSSVTPGGGVARNNGTSSNCTLTLKPGIGAAYTFSGVMVDGSSKKLGLTLNGPGKQTLAGVNTYTGSTTVSNGTLLVYGGLGAGTVTVTADGAFGGACALGGSLVFQDHATLACNFNATTNDTIDVTGSLVLGAHTTIRLSKTTYGRPYANHDFALITYTGADPSLGTWTVDYGETGWGAAKVMLDTASKRVLLWVGGKGTVVTLR